MKDRAHAVAVIAKRRIYETFISPGFYVTLALGLLLGYLLIRGFVRAIDSSGFNYTLNPLYDLIGRGLSGAFGATFLDKLFAEGPFLFALYLSFLPSFLYLALSSVFRFGLERKVGAVELVVFGPADGTSYLIAGFVKDLLLTLLVLAAQLAFFFLAAAINNLVLGPMFFTSLVMIFFLAMAVYAYGLLTSVLTDNASSSIALFLCLLIFFAIIMMGAFTIVSGYVRDLVAVLAWLIQWISPLYYWGMSLAAVEYGNGGLFFLSLLFSILLSLALLLASHVTLKIRGVHP